ncbi:MAG: hypothetical protein FJ220_02015 [Kiritimatiellaceae bacterium]|nr:hypothetical protein [Kiritimatiellaceae bacterium]
MAFLYDPAHIHVAPGGTLQEGFVTNAKPIEHLLFHNGTPLTAERYHYYEYTDMEAADMVKMAYLEMLGRQPTEQELLDGKNSFLIDPKPETLINEAQKQYGDAFRRELMKRPEFIQKFGEVATQNLQSFRVSRWRDRIQAIDKASILKTGHFAHPSAVYDRVLAQLIYTPTEANAEIVKVSPELPEKMAKGESVQIAVTVKNTGKTAWENKANQPARFALASVGDDTTFGFTRADLPDDVSVLPGQSYTFHLKLTAPPVRWAGKDKSTATLFPYNLKMIQESVGNFGETLASHAGKIPQIAVIHVAQPPPESVYNSTFISQILQGDPQIHGIRPGAKFVVNLTFKNAGSSTTEAWSKSKGFSLGSENAKDNRTWGNNRIALDDAVVVPYGETVTIQGVLTAPLEEGTYNFQWQLLGAGWFGQKSENLSITVSPTAPVIELTDSQFVSMKIPKQVTSDKPFAAEVTFKNAGTTAWSDGELSPVVSLMDQTDEPYAVITSQHSDSVREETADKLFDNDPSTKYFTRNASAWIQHQFASKARHKVVKYSITSAPDAGPGEELMANGSFEEGIEGWKLVPGASLSTNDAVFGSASLMVSSQAGKNIGNSTFTLQGLKPNTDYALSFWMRQEPDMQGAFVIDTEDVFDRTCQWVKNGGQPTVWTRYRGLFNTAAVDAGKQANPTSLTIRVRSEALSGTCYVDGISLVETSGGGMKGDPQQWILHGSNDGTTWTMVDSRNGIEFSARSQRQMFEVVQPGEYEFYRFDAKNWGGGTLQFGEIELYTEPAKSLWTGTPRASMTAGEVIPPGTNYTFTLNLTAPAKAGTFEFQGRMMQKGSAEAVGMGAYTPVYSVQVLPEK